MTKYEFELEVDLLKNFKIRLYKSLVLYYGEYKTFHTEIDIIGNKKDVVNIEYRWKISGEKNDLKGLKKDQLLHIGNITSDTEISDLSEKQKIALVYVLMNNRYDGDYIKNRFKVISKIDNFKSLLNNYLKHKKELPRIYDYLELRRYIKILDVNDPGIMNIIKNNLNLREGYRLMQESKKKGPNFKNTPVERLVNKYGLERVKKEYLKLSPDNMIWNFTKLFSIIYDVKFGKSDYIVGENYKGMDWNLELLLTADPEYFQQVYDKLGVYKVLFYNKISVEETIDILNDCDEYIKISRSWHGNYNNDYRGTVHANELSFNEIFKFHFENDNLEVCKLLFSKYKKLRESITRRGEKYNLKFTPIIPIKIPENDLVIGDRKMSVTNVNYVEDDKYRFKGKIDNLNGEVVIHINDYLEMLK